MVMNSCLQACLPAPVQWLSFNPGSGINAYDIKPKLLAPDEALSPSAVLMGTFSTSVFLLSAALIYIAMDFIPCSIHAIDQPVLVPRKLWHGYCSVWMTLTTERFERSVFQ
ncbi:hypothetical protein BaRGS_00001135 [Batillaria attramentaria]|uniref:Uncharacterized protein n=1 Tax=Batillaria attramentaria TaxID=370345 RepID=A0ABD0M5J0_9CAEN